MGAFFRSYDEAWEAFLVREEPLEDFFASWPEDEGYIASVWLIEPPAAVKEAALRLQESFAALGWVVPTPRHFLHVALGLSPWRPRLESPVDIEYRHVNAFHDAVIVEAHSPQLAALYDEDTALPHLTIGYPRGGPAAPLRDAELGRQRVEEVMLVQVPAARTTQLRPWAVEEVVRLTG